MAVAQEIEDFMRGPLVTWFCSCLDNPDRLTEYEDLADGTLIHEVLLQIDPEPMHHGVSPSHGNHVIRIKNMHVLIKNIKCLYEEELGQVVLVLPDCVKLGREPDSKAGLENMQLLLLLLLGCAVQCPNKETFIEHIKALDVDVQHDIVDCIKQVTDNHHIVLTQEATDVFPSDLMVNHIRRLVKERDDYLQHWTSLVLLDRGESSVSNGSPSEAQRKASASGGTSGDSYHLAVELADWKARLRKQRQELEEKSEALAECREDLEHQKALVTRLRQEVQELMQDARAAKAYRDELDAVRERAERVDKLEVEVQRYREKLSDIEFYKTRVEELREDNRVLLETREMLEEQLASARRRGDHVLQLEGDVLKCKQHINELTLERDAQQDKLQELFEENAQLQLLARSALNDSSSSATKGDGESDGADVMEGGSGDNSLSEQLTSNAQARALRLELENKRLLSAIDSLKESSFHESSNKILELEKEKKKLSIKVEKSRVEELEKSLEGVSKEKQQLQSSASSLQRRLEEQERLANTSAQQAEEWKAEAQRVPAIEATYNEAKAKLETLERENAAMQKEVTRLRSLVEEKDVALDQRTSEATVQEKELARMKKDLDDAFLQITRLQEVEREGQEVASRAAADRQALSTLQNELVRHKLGAQQLRHAFEKLGLDPDQLQDPETVLDRILLSQEVVRGVKELLEKEGAAGEPVGASTDSAAGINQSSEDLQSELLALQSTADTLQSDNAQLQVTVSTLQSQVSSLSTQYTALQLANSQLAAEKDELMKEKGLQQAAHNQLLKDQDTLQSLHEVLSTQYESLCVEREGLKGTIRDLRSEIRLLKTQNEKQHEEYISLQQESDKFKTESHSLGNLRAEHSSLKDDFRQLFTANEKLRKEYHSSQLENRTMRVENGNLKLRLTEQQGELAKCNDHITALEVELSKKNNKFELLLQMNNSYEDDKRVLMDHMSQMLSQIHDLVTHSLEDKQHYHMEEKMLTDKLNNIRRQKEKLEEKIMEHYRRLDSCSTKKKSFGATLVKRVRKAGSEFMSKVPRNRRSWREDSQLEEHPQPCHGSESGEGGNESDTSMDDARSRLLRDTHNSDGFTQSSLSLGSAGTRRTVKIQDDRSSFHGTTELPDTSNSQQDQSRFLVYNRISTVIGGGDAGVASQNQALHEAPSQGSLLSTRSHSPAPGDNKRGGPSRANKSGKTDNSVWYEYGCV
ncbi:Protein hook [Gryllus bimaculatus]|nr:Protein hook [Gryllus bimaculatus]